MEESLLSAEVPSNFIPARLTVPLPSVEGPSPVPVGASFTTVSPEDEINAGFSIALRNDAKNPVIGEFHVTVHLANSKVELGEISVDLTPGLTSEYTLVAGPGWTWDDVIYVDLAFSPSKALA